MSSRSAMRRALDDVEDWIARLGERFAVEHDDVQAEIRDEAFARALSDGAIDWQASDTRICRARVVSRYRLRAYGAMPESFAEWMRQTNEVRRRLDMELLGEPGAQQDAPLEGVRSTSRGPDAVHVWVMPDGRKRSAALRPEGAMSLREWQAAHAATA